MPAEMLARAVSPRLRPKAPLLKEQKIKTIVAERIPLGETPRAHENLGRPGVTGKQVLICDEEAPVQTGRSQVVTKGVTQDDGLGRSSEQARWD